MVLIYSSNTDLSTNYVIDWLNYFNVKWHRVNEFEFGKQIKLTLRYGERYENDTMLEDDIHLKDFNSIWIRRYSYSTELTFSSDADIGLIQQILHNLEIERKSVWQSLNRNSSNKNLLNNFESVSLSKIKQLETAILCGLKIPKSLITTKKSDLLKFFNDNNKSIISKPIESYSSLVQGESTYTPYTNSITKGFIDGLSDDFFPMLFQENIEKEFEVRSFYLNGEFYSMAMFTQNENDTKIDFRIYNKERPARRVRFKLHNDIEAKLHKFMLKENLNCGSFDLIAKSNGDLYFLEVNPVGQFGMVSYPCNYKLEKRIAEFFKTKN